MVYILAALALVGLGFWALGRFKRANVVALAKRLRMGAGIAAGVLAVAATLRGMIGYAMPLATLSIWLLAGGKGLPWRTSGQPAGGNASRIVTNHLEMELDHDTGAMRGRVLKGIFAGRAIERLAPAELALLWRDCRFEDPKSAHLIETWLDRTHPSWREDMARAEGSPGAGGIMTRDEAYEIIQRCAMQVWQEKTEVGVAG